MFDHSTDPYPLSDEQSGAVIGAGTLLLSAEDKRGLLRSWQQFLQGGFGLSDFSQPLHRFLRYGCHLEHRGSREQFWQHHCGGDLRHLQALLRMFGGDHRHPEQGDHGWLAAPAADLKAAMCAETVRLYAPLSQVLHDLDSKHEALIEAWGHFAAAANISEVALPPRYQISANTRHLLAYAAGIALRCQRPLTGLQLRFPLQPALLSQEAL